jgi:hypothetical protein
MQRAYLALESFDSSAVIIINPENGDEGTLAMFGYWIGLDRQADRLAIKAIDGPWTVSSGQEHLRFTTTELPDKLLEVQNPPPPTFKSVRSLIDECQLQPALSCYSLEFALLLDGKLDALFPGAQPESVPEDELVRGLLLETAQGAWTGRFLSAPKDPQPIARIPAPTLVRLRGADTIADLALDQATHRIRSAIIHVDATWLGLPTHRRLKIFYCVMASKTDRPGAEFWKATAHPEVLHDPRVLVALLMDQKTSHERKASKPAETQSLAE